MKILDTGLRDVKVVRPTKHHDDRGWFAEIYNAKDFAAAGFPGSFVQDNLSFSSRGVLRGLHYQLQEQQAKLVRVLSGAVWDVTVDLRRGSPDFGKWTALELSQEVDEWVWIPEGFAHGFLVLSETATVLYKTNRFWRPDAERCVRWNDPTLNIQWPLDAAQVPVLSSGDAAGSLFAGAELPPAYPIE